MAIVLLSIDREMLVESSYIKDEIDKARQSSSGLIIRQKEPNNVETPFEEVDSFLTSTELFYVRSHSRAPKLELVSYQLHIDGAVRNPFSLSCQELRDMPCETRVARARQDRDRASEKALMHASFGGKEVAQVAALRALARRGDPAVVRISSLPCPLKNASSILCGYPA